MCNRLGSRTASNPAVANTARAYTSRISSTKRTRKVGVVSRLVTSPVTCLRTDADRITSWPRGSQFRSNTAAMAPKLPCIKDERSSTSGRATNMEYSATEKNTAIVSCAMAQAPVKVRSLRRTHRGFTAFGVSMVSKSLRWPSERLT